jgi:transcriptional regulator with XRE-family HTH domain
MNTPAKIAETIETLAFEKRITIAAIQRELTLPHSFVNGIKRGSMPAADKLAKFADYFDVSVDYLLGRTENREVNR